MDIESIMLAILETAFNSQIEDTGELLIKNEVAAELYLLLTGCLIDISKFKMYGEYSIERFYNLIRNSYWNYHILSNIFDTITKLIYKANGHIAKTLIDLAHDINVIHTFNNNLKIYINLLRKTNGEKSMLILNSITKLMKVNTQRAVFVFKGTKNSGIGLKCINLPKEGYCFFAFIRFEPNTKSMCIYNFNSSAGDNISLLIKDEIIHYKVLNSANSQSSSIKFEGIKIQPNGIWYFIELYHTLNFLVRFILTIRLFLWMGNW